MAEIEEILARLIERVEGRHFGKYRGEVVDNDDPDDLGRIKAKVPRLAHDEELGWALPAFPYGGKAEQGFYFVPDIGASVWIEFEAGDLSYPIWSGTWYGDGELPEGADFSKKVLKTKSGHKIILDDGDQPTLEITDSNGNTITMEQSTITVGAGSATKIVVNAPQIELIENAGHPLVLGDNLLQYLQQLVTLLQAHTHAPASPPSAVLPVPSPGLLSRKVKSG